MSLPSTPVKVNTFYSQQFPTNPAGDAWQGTLTSTLQLYKPYPAEQGYGYIVDNNFEILDNAMLRDWNQIITGVNEFQGRVAVREPQARDEAAQRLQIDNAHILYAMGGW